MRGFHQSLVRQVRNVKWRIRLVIRNAGEEARLWKEILFPDRWSVLRVALIFAVLEVVLWDYKAAADKQRVSELAAAYSAGEGQPIPADRLVTWQHYRLVTRLDGVALLAALTPHGDVPVLVRDLPIALREGDRFRWLRSGRFAL